LDGALLYPTLNMTKHLHRRFTEDDLGQDLVEYALLLSFLALATLAGMRSLGSGIDAKYTNIAAALTAADSGVSTPGDATPGAGTGASGGGAGGAGSGGGSTGNNGDNGNHGAGNNGNGKGGTKP
jgi:Flp pilus assembly pilin Flp